MDFLSTSLTASPINQDLSASLGTTEPSTNSSLLSSASDFLASNKLATTLFAVSLTAVATSVFRVPSARVWPALIAFLGGSGCADERDRTDGEAGFQPAPAPETQPDLNCPKVKGWDYTFDTDIDKGRELGHEVIIGPNGNNLVIGEQSVEDSRFTEPLLIYSTMEGEEIFRWGSDELSALQDEAGSGYRLKKISTGIIDSQNVLWAVALAKDPNVQDDNDLSHAVAVRINLKKPHKMTVYPDVTDKIRDSAIDASWVYITSITQDPSDRIIVGGEILGGPDLGGPFMTRIDPNNIESGFQFKVDRIKEEGQPTRLQIYQVGTDKDSHIYFAGIRNYPLQEGESTVDRPHNIVVGKLNATGDNIEWQREFPVQRGPGVGGIPHLSISKDGYPYVSYSPPRDKTDLWVRLAKLDPATGESIWENESETTAIGTPIVIDETHNEVLFGSNQRGILDSRTEPNSYELITYDFDGNPRSSSVYSLIEDSARVSNFSLTACGHRVFTGSYRKNNDFSIIDLVLWTAMFPREKQNNDAN